MLGVLLRSCLKVRLSVRLECDWLVVSGLVAMDCSLMTE